MVQSDALSRRPDLVDKEDNNNKNVVFLHYGQRYR
uniref:Uncharacterized protein n=1 Tax=Moniliophthora roreri TaxID=221103 RepID=A0A0W0GFB2_MONRR